MWYTFIMKQGVIKLFLALAIVVLTNSQTTSIVRAQEVVITGENVEYMLEYPGLLPDHPLYMLKNIRDRVTFFLNRDYIKKAELLLLYSDKKIHAATLLSQKGKWQLATQTLIESERMFADIPEHVITAKKQGTRAPEALSLDLKLSNQKHRQIIETFLKEAPGGERAEIENALRINLKIKQDLLTL